MGQTPNIKSDQWDEALRDALLEEVSVGSIVYYALSEPRSDTFHGSWISRYPIEYWDVETWHITDNSAVFPALVLTRTPHYIERSRMITMLGADGALYKMGPKARIRTAHA